MVEEGKGERNKRKGREREGGKVRKTKKRGIER